MKALKFVKKCSSMFTEYTASQSSPGSDGNTLKPIKYLQLKKKLPKADFHHNLKWGLSHDLQIRKSQINNSLSKYHSLNLRNNDKKYHHRTHLCPGKNIERCNAIAFVIEYNKNSVDFKKNWMTYSLIFLKP